MKPILILLILFPVFFFFACHHTPATTGTDHPKTPDTPAKKNYFPVLNFLKGEIAYVDSFPFKLMEYRIRNGKTDSTLINTQTFNDLAKPFLSDDLDSARFEAKFDESSFLDRSTNLLTFTYSTKDTSYGLRRVDVLAVPDLGADKVQSIYLESSSGNADSLVLSKMYWKSGRNFSILHIYQPKHGEASSSQVKVVWDSSE
jgi:hypothetical protein